MDDEEGRRLFCRRRLGVTTYVGRGRILWRSGGNASYSCGISCSLSLFRRIRGDVSILAIGAKLQLSAPLRHDALRKEQLLS